MKCERNWQVTVIISFHPVFITKVDKAFAVNCFYGEVSREVSASFEVSMLPTTELLNSPGMPKCMYSVRRDAPDGLPITFAQVGERVFHRWECDSEMYGLVVKDCFVMGEEKGEEKPVEVLDSRGCTTDPVLLEQLTYDTRAPLAYAQSHVFKFADVSRTHFKCNIQICLRDGGGCDEITPPNCDPLNRLRRSIPLQLLESDEMDVAQALIVLDLDERLPVRSNHSSAEESVAKDFCSSSITSTILIVFLGCLSSVLCCLLCLVIARRSSPDLSKVFLP